MKTQTVIQNIRQELLLALPPTIPVRTSGGDGSAKPPLCIIEWKKRRLPYEGGHRPLGGILRDENGEAVGRELHRFYEMELDVTIRSYDEGDRDTLLSDVSAHFLPFEYESRGFHVDTTEWEVGDEEPRSNQVIEPDWYEGGLTIRFKYITRVEQIADSLTSVQENVSN